MGCFSGASGKGPGIFWEEWGTINDTYQECMVPIIDANGMHTKH